MQINKFNMMLLSVVSCAILLNGCGSSSKEGTSGGVALVDEGTCIVCHSTTTDPVSGTNLVHDYAQSIHNPANVPANTPVNAGNPDGCQGCHGDGAEHNGVGPIPFPDPIATSRCIVCHTTATAALFTTELPKEDFAGNCKPCHTDGTAGIHGATLLSSSNQRISRDDCVGCHDVSKNAPPHRSDSIVSDNSGVRAIVPEFQKTSHHIVNGSPGPTNAQCIVCHAEGKASGTTVVTDSNFHMKDGNIYLRNGNTNLGQTPDKSTTVNSVSVYAWNPATPDHTLMDQFCFSCHNQAGAPTTFANLSSSLKAAFKSAIIPAQASATNPFGDTISNGYDQMSRSTVVNVYDAFSPTNASHHAVRAQKYTGRTRATVANPSVFTKYSGAAVSPSAANGMVGIGQTSPGTRKTLYEAGYFVAKYTPLGASATVGDDSTLHCGDCHTVGQFKPGSTTDANGVATTAAIGAHGSVNEYMLRTTTGVDAIHFMDDNTASNSTYVCFLCHVSAVYGNGETGPVPYTANFVGGGPAPSKLGGHAGLHPCDSAAIGETTGQTGSARRAYFGNLPGDGDGGVGDPADPTTNGDSNGGGNVFGYTCANCHNGGNTGFGGIHGGNNVYGTYSATGGYANNASTDANVARVYRKTYRFMGGLSLKYNSGASPDKWEMQTLQKTNREGCYNFTVVQEATGLTDSGNQGRPNTPGTKDAYSITPKDAGTDSKYTQWRTDSTTEFKDGTSGGTLNPTGTVGTWGACGHHNGTVNNGANATPERKVQRPLIY